MRINVVVEKIKCDKCGYIWKPRKDINSIRQCAKCKTTYWNSGETKYKKNNLIFG